MLEWLPVVSSCKLIDALRTWVATVDRTNVLGIETCRVAATGHTGSTTRFSNNALAAPVGTSSMIYVLGMAHLAASLTAVLVMGLFAENPKLGFGRVSVIPLQ